MPRFLRSLFGQVVLALIVGVLVGFAWPESAVKLKPLGDAFIKLVKMVIPRANRWLKLTCSELYQISLSPRPRSVRLPSNCGNGRAAWYREMVVALKKFVPRNASRPRYGLLTCC